MRLPRFIHHAPETLDEACRLMEELGEKAKPIAGGTDLIVNMKKGKLSPPHVVSLGKLKGLRALSYPGDFLEIGACRTVASLADAPEIFSRFTAVAMAAASLGSPLIRNLATIGGNLVTARPAADLPPPLMAFGAWVLLKSTSGERKVRLDEFFLGPGLTVMKPDEILTKVVIEKPPSCSGSGYIKLGRRRALEISIVSVAAFVSLDGPGGVVRSAGIVLGAVAPKPLRAESAERILVGEKPRTGLFHEAGEAAARESMPIDDFRGSVAYRRAMVSVLTERALRQAVELATRSAGMNSF